MRTAQNGTLQAAPLRFPKPCYSCRQCLLRGLSPKHMYFDISNSNTDKEHDHHRPDLTTGHCPSGWHSCTKHCFRGSRVRWPSFVLLLARKSLLLIFSSNWNNTYLCDSSSPCGGSDTPIKCAALCGGFLIESSSVSWSQAASFGALNTASEYFPDHAKDVPGNDTFHLNSTFSLPTFPFGISRLPAGSMNMIGLGTNSSLLNTLLSTGAIASRTWALFQGWTGAESEHQIDGSLVLGGYDTAKMTGSNTTIPFTQDQSCATHLVVVITDIKMNLKNGSNPSILGSSAGSAIKACIAPEFPIMSFSIDIWNSFKSVANVDDIGRSYGINFWGMIISANGS